MGFGKFLKKVKKLGKKVLKVEKVVSAPFGSHVKVKKGGLAVKTGIGGGIGDKLDKVATVGTNLAAAAFTVGGSAAALGGIGTGGSGGSNPIAGLLGDVGHFADDIGGYLAQAQAIAHALRGDEAAQSAAEPLPAAPEPAAPGLSPMLVVGAAALIVVVLATRRS